MYIIGKVGAVVVVATICSIFVDTYVCLYLCNYTCVFVRMLGDGTGGESIYGGMFKAENLKYNHDRP